MTWKSTLLCVLNLNLKPILVDIRSDSSNFDLEDLKKKITKNTSVIIGVHLYGNPIDIKNIKKIIKKKKIILIEDAAQAHGAYLEEDKVGSMGKIACFSFYPGKNLGALGDAGAITTSDKILADALFALRNYGSHQKYQRKFHYQNMHLQQF